jgi:enoyl-CoA hydratase/carnithine racemase
MTDKLLYEKADNIVTLTLNDPAVRNAISDESVIEGLVQALKRINDDYDVRCVILTGAGSAFSSGGNVKNMQRQAAGAENAAYDVRVRYLRGIQRIPLALYELEVPIIAAVNGYAIGAGCDLACMCDIRLAGKSARFAESFVKLGLIPGDGGAWFLPRVVGASNARLMSFTGEQFDADQALRMGLVSAVFDDDKLMDEARALARRIAANPAYGLRMAKRLLREGERTELQTLLDMSSSMQAIAHQSEDHKEAVNAFVEKRKPVFKNR